MDDMGMSNKKGCSCLACADGKCICFRQGYKKCGDAIAIPDIHEILGEALLNDRNKLLEKMRVAIEGNQLAMALGAGVSIPAGMPDWVKLISKMFGYGLGYRMDFAERHAEPAESTAFPLAVALSTGDLNLLNDINTLESAEYIAELFQDEQDISTYAFKSIIHRLIDDSLTPEELIKRRAEQGNDKAKQVLVDARTKDCNQLYRDISKIDTIFAVAYLLSKESGVQKAFTYNYDPLVQEYMMKMYSVSPDEIITHPLNWSSFKCEIKKPVKEVYHVHGFLRTR